MYTIDTSSSIRSQRIISQYQRSFWFIKKFAAATIGILIALWIITKTIGWMENITQDEQAFNLYIQSGNAIITNGLYIPDQAFDLAWFQAHIIWWWYNQIDNNHISKNNLLSYNGVALPQHITTSIASNYLEWNDEQKTSSYIERFIILNTGLLENTISISGSKLPQASLIETFKLDCLSSPLVIQQEFCEYNLNQFATQAYKYDLSFDFLWLDQIAKYIDTPETRYNLCNSIMKYQLLSKNFDPRFESILNSCDTSIIKKQNQIKQRNTIQKELQWMLSKEIYSETLWNQYKISSSMQILQNQLSENKIDIEFLKSYYSYIYAFLQSNNSDTFSVNLIYKYHNQYLIPWLIRLLKIVNVDTSIDIQNLIDTLDTLNNGDNVNLIGLRYRVNPALILPTDYASTHLPLDTNTKVEISWSVSSGIDNGAINQLIWAVDISINQWLQTWQTQESNTWLTDNNNINNQVTQSNTGTNTTTNQNNSNIVAYKPNTITQEDDLNSYKPKTVTTYAPANTESREKAIVSDRLLNHLGIKPDIIIAKWNKYFIEWSYKWFTFSALLDKDNDRKLSPIYVKIDNIRTIIPDFVLYLMDYDRYSQVKFLKNPESYIRQATQ